MKLQHSTYLEGIINILMSGFIAPPKRINIKSWSNDFLFFSIVNNKQFKGDCIYAPLNIIKKYNRYFIHPTSNLFGTLSKKNLKFKEVPSKKQIKIYSDLFNTHDKNNDGIVTLTQLNRILKNLDLAPYTYKKVKKFDFPSALTIIHKHHECKCSWEYISPQLATRLKIEKQKTEHYCTIRSLDKALGSFLIKKHDYCDGGNEIGFDKPIYVRDFECITISKNSFERLKLKDQELLAKLLGIYKRRGLKIKLTK